MQSKSKNSNVKGVQNKNLRGTRAGKRVKQRTRFKAMQIFFSELAHQCMEVVQKNRKFGIMEEIDEFLNEENNIQERIHNMDIDNDLNNQAVNRLPGVDEQQNNEAIPQNVQQLAAEQADRPGGGLQQGAAGQVNNARLNQRNVPLNLRGGNAEQANGPGGRVQQEMAGQVNARFIQRNVPLNLEGGNVQPANGRGNAQPANGRNGFQQVPRQMNLAGDDGYRFQLENHVPRQVNRANGNQVLDQGNQQQNQIIAQNNVGMQHMEANIGNAVGALQHVDMNQQNPPIQGAIMRQENRYLPPRRAPYRRPVLTNDQIMRQNAKRMSNFLWTMAKTCTYVPRRFDDDDEEENDPPVY